MSAEEVAAAFVPHYYQTLDGNVDALANLFQPASMMTFEGQQFQGSEAIIGKLRSIGQIRHDIKSTDIQPSAVPNAIIIFATGVVQISGDNPIHFCEMIHLVSNTPGQYYVHNAIFRLNYA